MKIRPFLTNRNQWLVLQPDKKNRVALPRYTFILGLCTFILFSGFYLNPSDQLTSGGSNMLVEDMVFIDQDVPQPAAILAAFEEQKESSPAFSLFTHGRPGELLIDGQWLEPAEIAGWLKSGDALAGKDQLHVYGCEFAKGEKGKAAVAYLEATLGVSVAASDDVTGVDGDWELEVGEAKDVLILDQYAYNLQPFTISGTVFEDNTDNMVVDGTPINGTLNGTTIYAYLSSESTNNIVFKTTVDASGNYSFSVPVGEYDLFLTSENLNVGNAQPQTPTALPGLWGWVGETDDTGGPNFTNPDGEIDIQSFSTGDPDVTGLNFGVRNNYTFTVSGTVFNDPDRATNGADGTGIGAPSGQQLYVYLVDDDLPTPALVAYKGTVNADGTYTITGVPQGDYEIYLTTVNLNIGNQAPNPPNVFLPGGWIMTVEDDNGAVNNDDTVDGRINFSNIVNSNVTEIDFGITQVNFISGTVSIDNDPVADNIGNTAPPITQGSYLLYLVDQATGNNVLDPVNGFPISASTAADGTYVMNDIPAGNYRIVIFDKAGFDNVADGDSVNDGPNDSDTNPTSGDASIPVSLLSGESDTGNDFVVRQQAGICLIWENQGLTSGVSFPTGTSYSVGGVNVQVDWQVVDNNGSLMPATVVNDFVQFQSGQQGADTGYIGLSMNNSENVQTDYVEVTWTFTGAPFTNLEFDVLDVDIDSRGLNSFVDGVEIFYNGNNNVRSTSFYRVNGVSTEEYNGGGINGFKGQLPEANPSGTTGNVTLDFGTQVITDITLRYYSTPDAQANPENQFIGVSDFCLTTVFDISGNVFKDANELNDNMVNGTGIGAPGGEQIYAYLVNDNADIIVATTPVAANGTYSFPDIASGTAYDVVISTQVLAVGDAEPTPTYPTNWFIVGEFDPETSTVDATPEGNVDLEPLTANITNVNFGLNFPSISNPSAAQNICQGSVAADITVGINSNNANIIRFVRFTTDQMSGTTPTATEATNIYAGTAVATVTPTGVASPYTATLTTTAAGWSALAPGTYYIYAIINPDPGADCRTVREIVVTIVDIPELTTTNGTVCGGGSIDLATLVTNTGGGTLSYHPTLAAAESGTPALPFSMVSPASTTTYYVRSDAGGDCFTAKEVIITVVSPPDFSVTNGTLCSGGSIDLATLVNNSVGGTLSYHGTLAAAQSGTPALASSTVSPASATNYYVRSTNSSGCFTVREVTVTLRSTNCGTITISGPNQRN